MERKSGKVYMQNSSKRNKIKLSFCIICQDEEEMISRCLRFMLKVKGEIKGETEFVIVDGGSEDNTLNILEKFAEQIGESFHLYQNTWPGFANQLNYRDSKASGEWILSLAADEVLSDDIFSMINMLLASDTVNAYSFPTLHLLSDHQHMWDVENQSPCVRLRRNLPNFSWCNKGGMENLYFDDKIVIQHASHFSFDWQSYVPDVKVIHFGELKSQKQKLNRLLRYSKLEGSHCFGWTQDQLIKMLDANYFTKCPISKHYDGLTFFSGD